MSVEGYLGEVVFRDGVLYVDLWYPGADEESVREIVISLMHVRAADDLRVSYDFERDGWRLGTDTMNLETHGVVAENVERAFVPAWHEEAP